MTRPDPTPNVPIRETALDGGAWTEFSRGARFRSRDLPLSDLGGGTQIGLAITELPPGAQSCPFHFHDREEEQFYILEGRAVLRSGDERFAMEAGDYVCFPAGTGVAHAFENPFDRPCRYLSIGNRFDEEVCGYPDSGKLSVKTRRGRVIAPMPASSLEYWHGEPVDEPL